MSTMPENESSRLPMASTPPSGHDPVLERMKERGLPLTRKMYLTLAYPDGVPDPLPAEEEALIPDELTV